MPTFPNFWAGVSGTIESNETPYQAAQRELSEETNITEIVNELGGLYINVPHHVSPRTEQERIIRVYPFVVHVPDELSLELRGTEHERYKFVSVSELQGMQSECVPGLVQAFHHATYGKYDATISDSVRQWASNFENGASVMTNNALRLLAGKDPIAIAPQIAMLRPSMVPIVNVMNGIIVHHQHNKNNTDKNDDTAVTTESFQSDLQRCVHLGIDALKELEQSQTDKRLTIATFSRSGTLAKILKPFASSSTPHHRIICGQSAPGNEGELMATKDLDTAEWVPDAALHQMLAGLDNDKTIIDVLLVGSDCILTNQMVNKVGTKRLCEIAHQHQVPVYCCADRWKVWDDIFPPPLEKYLFELVPLELITKLLVPLVD